MNTQTAITEVQMTRIYRDMMYKSMSGVKFPVMLADKSFGATTWIGKAADVRMSKHNSIEVFNGYTWQTLSITTLRIWLRKARQQRTTRRLTAA